MDQCIVCSYEIKETMVFCPDCGSNLNIQKINRDQAIIHQSSPDMTSEQMKRYIDLSKRLEKLEMVDEEYVRQDHHFHSTSQDYEVHWSKIVSLEDQLEKNRKKLNKLNKPSLLSLKSIFTRSRQEDLANTEERIDELEFQLEQEKTIHEKLLKRVKEAERQLAEVKELKKKKENLKKELYQLMQGIDFEHPNDDQIEAKIEALEEQLTPINLRYIKLQAVKDYIEQALDTLNKADQFRKTSKIGNKRNNFSRVINKSIKINLELFVDLLGQVELLFIEAYNHYPEFIYLQEIYNHTGGKFRQKILKKTYNPLVNKFSKIYEDLAGNIDQVRGDLQYILKHTNAIYHEVQEEKEEIETKIENLQNDLAKIRIDLLNQGVPT